jgi:hypothetical protein
MSTYDLFGISVGMPARTTDDNAMAVTAVTQIIGSALAIEFQQHYSTFWNGEYYVHKNGQFGEIKITNNVADDDPEDAPHVEYRYPVIVSVAEASAPDELRDRLIALGLTHLRRRVM